MMASNKKLLSAHQLYFLTVQSVSSVMIFAIPYLVNEHSKHNAWISAIITLIFFQLIGWVIFSLHKRLPDKNLFQMTEILTSKWIGKIMNWLYIVYFIGLATYTAIYFTYLSKEWTLPVTPLFVVYLIFILMGLYIARGTITTLARFSGITLLALTGFLLFSICFAIPKMHLLFLLPVGNVPVTKILNGSYHMGIGYAGLSSLLVLLPLLQDKLKTKKRVITFSILTISLIYLFLLVICLAHFGTYALGIVPIPVLYLLKILTVLSIFERMDLIIMGAWIAPMLVSYVLYIFMAGIGISENTRFKNKKIIVLVITLIISILCALFPEAQDNIVRLNNYLLPFTYVFMIGFPILLLAIAMIRKINQSHQNQAGD